MQVDSLNWTQLFGSLPSTLHIRPTNPTNTDVSTADTIEQMNAHALADVNHPAIQSAIDEILEQVSDRADETEVTARTHEWIKDHVEFVEDEELTKQLFNIPIGVELLITPARLLTMHHPMGDCDDFSTLAKCLLHGMGIRNHFTTVAATKELPRKWSHVYNTVVTDEGKVIPFDSSHGKLPGWEVQGVTRKALWGDGKDSYEAPAVSLQQQAQSAEGGKRMFESLNGIGEIDWGDIFEPLAKAGGTILTAQYGQPQLAPNTYIQTTPQGSIITNQPYPGGGINFGAQTGGIGASTLLIGGVVILGAILLLGRH